MIPYRWRKLLLRAVIALPAPRALDRFLRFWVHTRAGEGFADPTINGELRFLRRHGPACHLVLDVGAHGGEWARHAVECCPEARIHCFEPLAEPFGRLVGRDFPPRVSCHRLALSREAGSAEMSAATLSLHPRRLGAEVEGGRRERVQRTTLEDFCRQHGIDRVDFLKVDVEGHELAVLEGGRKMIEEGRVLRVQLEYGPWNVWSRVLLRDLFAFFEGLPYAVHQVVPGGLHPLPAYDPRLENFQYKNLAVLHGSVAAGLGG